MVKIIIDKWLNNKYVGSEEFVSVGMAIKPAKLLTSQGYECRVLDANDFTIIKF